MKEKVIYKKRFQEKVSWSTGKDEMIENDLIANDIYEGLLSDPSISKALKQLQSSIKKYVMGSIKDAKTYYKSTEGVEDIDRDTVVEILLEQLEQEDHVLMSVSYDALDF